MPRTNPTRSASWALADAAAIAALAGVTPAAAGAGDDDMDGKVILCMPAGFPSGCRDAFDHDGDAGRPDTVNTFCYGTACSRRGWTSHGSELRTHYTNPSRPERTDVWGKLTVEPDTAIAYSPGGQTFDAGLHRGAADIRHTE